MTYEQFKNAIETICENESAWADWAGDYSLGVLDIEAWLGASFTERQAEIVERAIESDGATLGADMQALEREVWGYNFAHGGV